MKRVVWLTAGMLCLFASALMAQPVSEAAREYMLRGQAALEMARTPAELQMAVDELRRAAELAPDWPDVHFNLGLVQSRADDPAGAITSYQRYLELRPNAEDAAKVRDEIVKLKYRLERQQRVTTLSGAWYDSQALRNISVSRGSKRVYVGDFDVVATGNQLVIRTEFFAFNESDGTALYDILGTPGEVPLGRHADSDNIAVEFRGSMAGNALHGEWSRAAGKESACSVSGQSGTFTGSISPDGYTITLTYTWTRVYVVNKLPLFGDTACRGVTEQGPVERKLILVKKLPAGGVGMELHHDGHNAVTVVAVAPGLPAAQGGVRVGDRVVAVDGQVLHGMSVTAINHLMRGQPGTRVVVRIVRAGGAATEDVVLTRVDLEAAAAQQRAAASATSAKKGASATSSACFIATAAYGSPFEEHVATLREFRDHHLLTNAPGRWFVAQYYEHSPPLADYIREREGLRTVVRGVLTPVVYAVRHPVWALLAVFLLLTMIIGWRRRRALLCEAV